MRLKILYISPENTVGTLTLWKKTHESLGNECRTVTFFKSPKKFDEDICLNLPFNFTKPWLARIRNSVYKLYRGDEGYFKPRKGFPPEWKPEGWFDAKFLKELVDEEDDWEITNYGIDPELGGRYGVDFDDEVGFRD